MSMTVSKLVSFLEEVEKSIDTGDVDRARDIVHYLIEDIIDFELKHSKEFAEIHKIVKAIKTNDNDLIKAEVLSGGITGEA